MELRTPPQVPRHPVLGNLPAYRRDPLAFGRSVAAEYGDVVGLRVLNRRLMLLAHPEHVHQVLVRDADKFHKSPVYRIFLGRALGEGLLTSDGELWRRQRRLAQPAFHHGRIQSYAETMVEYAGAAAGRWAGQGTLDVHQEMNQLTLEVVCRTLFSTDIRAHADRIGAALTELLEAITEATGQPIFFPEWLPTRLNRRIRRGVSELDAVVMPLIEARRKSGEDTGDLLSMLMRNSARCWGANCRASSTSASSLTPTKSSRKPCASTHPSPSSGGRRWRTSRLAASPSLKA